jgi:L,D-transpeptidase YcbB
MTTPTLSFVRSIWLFGVAAAATMLLTGCGPDTEPAPGEVQAMQALFRAGPDAQSSRAGKDGEGLLKQAQEFYAQRNYQPAWIADGQPLPAIDALKQLVSGTGSEGLDPKAYGLGQIQIDAQVAKAQTADAPAATAAADLQLTVSLLRYAAALAQGSPISGQISSTWQTAPKQLELGRLVSDAVSRGSLAEIMSQLAPPHEEYHRLAQALEQYRHIAANGGWRPLPADLKLSAEASSPHWATLRKNLVILGDLADPEAPDATRADKNLTEAIMRFQRRHGLEAGGIVDAKLVNAMNVPVDDRIRQIEINMDRWRWLPRDLGPRHVHVNVPEYRLIVREGGRTVLESKVVVGTDDNRTPIFSDQMTHLVFSPYWNIPESIALKETLPAIRKDPGYFERKELEVYRVVNGKAEVIDPASIDWEAAAAEDFDFQIRQKPSDQNALGLVKFMFPNRFNVYLHDTPADNLFDRLTRSLSHGCVRVEKPRELASYVLSDQKEWTQDRIEMAMHSQEEKYVNLSEPLPVHITYLTARVDADGLIQFFDDVYGYDQKHKEILNGSAAQDAKAAEDAAPT